MSKQEINIGQEANDGTGDQLRVAFDKVNQNTDELYDAGPVGSNIQIIGNTISGVNANGEINIVPGIPGGTASVVIKGNTLIGLATAGEYRTFIVSGESTFNDKVIVNGNVEVQGNVLTVDPNNPQEVVTLQYFEDNIAGAGPKDDIPPGLRTMISWTANDDTLVNGYKITDDTELTFTDPSSNINVKHNRDTNGDASGSLEFSLATDVTITNLTSTSIDTGDIDITGIGTATHPDGTNPNGIVTVQYYEDNGSGGTGMTSWSAADDDGLNYVVSNGKILTFNDPSNNIVIKHNTVSNDPTGTLKFELAPLLNTESIDVSNTLKTTTLEVTGSATIAGSATMEGVLTVNNNIIADDPTGLVPQQVVTDNYLKSFYVDGGTY